MAESTHDIDQQAPQPPEKPLPGDCCGGGCQRCVFDLYDEAMQRYEQALEQWQRK